jgi:hypothetical protein
MQEAGEDNMPNLDGIRAPQARSEANGYLIGFAAEDPGGEKVGTVKAVWDDDSGSPAYIGVATGWLGLGRIHVVPAQDAAISGRDRRIRFPFAAGTIKAGPEFVADYALEPEGERFIRAYYRDQFAETDADFNPDPGDPSLYTGLDILGPDPDRRPGSAEPDRSDWGAGPDGDGRVSR